jgi:Spy/CpxP family protein refolding chaperone
MTRMRKVVAGGVIAGLLVGGAGLVWAERPENVRHRGPHARMGMPGAAELRGLDLTEAQQSQIRSIREQYADGIRQAAERLRVAQTAQQDALAAAPLDEGLVRATVQEAVDARVDALILSTRMRADVRSILTPEQQAQLDAPRGERGGRMPLRGRPGGDRPRGAGR